MENQIQESDTTLADIGDISQTLSAEASEIESQTTNAFNLYDQIRERADQGVPEEIGWSFNPEEVKLSDIGIDEASVPILTSVQQDLHNIDHTESVDFESETVSEYVDDISSRIEEVKTIRSQLESRIEAAEQISDQAYSEFVKSTELLQGYDDPESALEGSWGEKLENHLDAKKGRAETRKAVEEMTTELRSEETALQTELTNVINSYVSEAYDKAVSTSEQLGGRQRPGTGELDLLGKIADSRAEIIQNREDPDQYDFVPPEVAAQTALMDISKEAMESQANLVAQISAHLGQALQHSYGLVEQGEQYLDNKDNLESSYDAITAMEQGFDEMANMADDECYDSLAEAVRQVMRGGMTEDEEFNDEYSFEMDGIPHIGSNQEPAAGGR